MRESSARSTGTSGYAELDGAELKELLRTLFTSPTYRPPVLPQVALELVQLSSRPDLDYGEVVKLLEQDPVLAAKVLSLAQSAVYATRTHITSLRQAAVRLGLKTLRDVVLEAALHVRVFRVRGYDTAMARLARHSSATAHVMRAVCARALVDQEHAFLLGLLHDVGFAGGLLAVAEDPDLRHRTFEDLAPVLDEVHQEASGTLARLWRLPPAVQRALETHHQVKVNEAPQRVNAAIIVAEQLVWEAGAGMLPPEGAEPMMTETPEPPLEALDANWTGAVREAMGVLGMNELALCAARVEAWEILKKAGLLAPS
jgi:HD-like signal output (HDOD) protein